MEKPVVATLAGLPEPPKAEKGEDDAVARIADQHSAEERKEEKHRHRNVDFVVAGKDSDEVENRLGHVQVLRHDKARRDHRVVLGNVVIPDCPAVFAGCEAQFVKPCFRDITLEVAEAVAGVQHSVTCLRVVQVCGNCRAAPPDCRHLLGGNPLKLRKQPVALLLRLRKPRLGGGKVSSRRKGDCREDALGKGRRGYHKGIDLLTGDSHNELPGAIGHPLKGIKPLLPATLVDARHQGIVPACILETAED